MPETSEELSAGLCPRCADWERRTGLAWKTIASLEAKAEAAEQQLITANAEIERLKKQLEKERHERH